MEVHEGLVLARVVDGDLRQAAATAGALGHPGDGAAEHRVHRGADAARHVGALVAPRGVEVAVEVGGDPAGVLVEPGDHPAVRRLADDVAGVLVLQRRLEVDLRAAADRVDRPGPAALVEHRDGRGLAVPHRRDVVLDALPATAAGLDELHAAGAGAVVLDPAAEVDHRPPVVAVVVETELAGLADAVLRGRGLRGRRRGDDRPEDRDAGGGQRHRLLELHLVLLRGRCRGRGRPRRWTTDAVRSPWHLGLRRRVPPVVTAPRSCGRPGHLRRPCLPAAILLRTATG